MDETPVPPAFLTLSQVLRIHLNQINEFGGDRGVRDQGLIESAIAQPQQMFGGKFLHEDLASMAAAYLFHIVSNHGFVDGNKRTGAQVALLFLAMNEVEVIYPADARAMILRVAAGEAQKDNVIEFFRRWLE